MFPLADTLRLTVFSSLRFRQNRTTFFIRFRQICVLENRCFRKRKCVASLRKHTKTFWKQINFMLTIAETRVYELETGVFKLFPSWKSAFHHLGVVFPPSVITKTRCLDIFIAQNNTKAIFPSTFWGLLIVFINYIQVKLHFKCECLFTLTMNKNRKRLPLRNSLECFCRTAYFFYFCKENVKSVNKLKSFIADS